MKNRIAALSLTLALSVGLCVPAHAAESPFTDVPADHWASEAISAMAQAGVVSGTGNGQFSPESPVSNAEFIAMITRQYYADQIEESDKYEWAHGFWWSPYMYAARRTNILSYGLLMYADHGGDFLDFKAAYPEDPISRYEMAEIIYNVLLDKFGYYSSAGFSISSIPDYLEIKGKGQEMLSAVRYCYEKELLSGVDSAGTFSGNTTMTRAQAAVIMERLVSGDFRVPHVPAGEIPAGALTLTGDNVQRLQATHYVDGKFVMDCNGITSVGSSITIKNDGYSTLTLTAEATADNQSVCVGDTSSLMGELLLAEALEVGTPKTYTVDVTSASEIQITIRNGSLSNGEIYDMYLLP